MCSNGLPTFPIAASKSKFINSHQGDCFPNFWTLSLCGSLAMPSGGHCAKITISGELLSNLNTKVDKQYRSRRFKRHTSCGGLKKAQRPHYKLHHMVCINSSIIPGILRQLPQPVISAH